MNISVIYNKERHERTMIIGTDRSEALTLKINKSQYDKISTFFNYLQTGNLRRSFKGNKLPLGCNNHIGGWTKSFICGKIDKFTGNLILCKNCIQKIKEGKQ